MTDEDLVSVIIPSFNRAALLGRAVDSAFRQTYPNIEVVVVDDGSTDHTAKWLKQIQSPNLKTLFLPTNVGPARARNLGIGASSGAYIAFLDSDDIWQPGKIAAQVACFRNGPPDLGAVYCGRRVRLADGTHIEIFPQEQGDVFDSLRRRNTVPLPTLMVKRSVLDDVGDFDPDLPACEDWDLALRIARRYTFDFIPEIAVLYDGTSGDRMSARARSVFIANHRIFRRYSGHQPERDVLATHLALQSRELLQLDRIGRAARYALKSLCIAAGDDERLAQRTLRQIISRWLPGRMLIQAYSLGRAFTWHGRRA